MASDCLFCGIVAGEVPAQIVDSDEHTVAFMDINPATRGHALVVPRAHSADLMEVSDEDLERRCSPRAAWPRKIDAALEPDGFNVLNSCGPAAWQTIFHFHLHVIPRYDDDPLKLPWIPRGGEADEIAALRAIGSGRRARERPDSTGARRRRRRDGARQPAVEPVRRRRSSRRSTSASTRSRARTPGRSSGAPRASCSRAAPTSTCSSRSSTRAATAPDLSFEPLLGAVRRLEALPIPTLALVHGLCLTAGLEVSLGCDMIWAGESARFGLVEAVVGLTPGAGGTQRMAERAGPARAREFVMSQGIYDAATLERWNVVNRVAPRRRAAREGDAVRAAPGRRPDQGARGDQADRPRLPARAASTRPTG